MIAIARLGWPLVGAPEGLVSRHASVAHHDVSGLRWRNNGESSSKQTRGGEGRFTPGIGGRPYQDSGTACVKRALLGPPSDTLVHAGPGPGCNWRSSACVAALGSCKSRCYSQSLVARPARKCTSRQHVLWLATGCLHVRLFYIVLAQRGYIKLYIYRYTMRHAQTRHHCLAPACTISGAFLALAAFFASIISTLHTTPALQMAKNKLPHLSNWYRGLHNL